MTTTRLHTGRRMVGIKGSVFAGRLHYPANDASESIDVLRDELSTFRRRKQKDAALARFVATGDRACWIKYLEWRAVQEGGKP